MKRILSALLTLSVGLADLTAQTAVQKGPIVDKVLFNARSQEDLGLMDVAAGKSDLWNYGSSGGVFKRLPADVSSKLEPYTVSGASYVGLLLNPFPNKAPYITDASVDASGKAQFNPLAVQKIRFALNWLINRQKIVDEVFEGAGLPMFTPVVPGLPNASRFSLVATKLGMSDQGNEKQALADIDSAMSAASALPELKGRLVKGSPYWTFDGAAVTIRFVIRADDPNSRLPVGRYIADQIEKAGIKVERLEYDRSKAGGLVNRTDPATYQWSVYTEGLGSNETKAYWEMTISYDYAPWASIMPGGNNTAFWNYQQPELDRLTQAVVGGNIAGAKEYWDNMTAAMNLGLKESVRIMVAGKTSYFTAAKDRFATRVAYGIGDGLDKWSTYTADVKAEKSGADAGKKVLRMTGFSSRGTLFMNAWDPVGTQGFGDTYSGTIVKQLSDLELEANPATGVPMAVRATWSNLKTASEPAPVPGNAVLWNASTQKWASGLSYAKDAQGQYGYSPASSPITAKSSATFAFRFGAWHDGRAIDQNDYRYALAFPYDLAFKGGANARAFDASYASGVNPRLARARGYSFNKDGSITVWSDAFYPMDQAQLASLMAPSLQVAAVNSGAILPWEILEALRSLVSESSASGTAWSFNTEASSVEVDLLNPKLVADLRATLSDFVATKRVPAALAGQMSPETAVLDYQLAIAWLDAHGHAYISNGGFLLERYDASGNTGILAAFRDKDYPFEAGYWVKALKSDYSRVESVTVADPRKSQDLKVTVKVGLVSFPAVSSTPSDKATVTVSLMVGDRAISAAAKSVKGGSYEALIPAAAVDGLAIGAYTVVAESSLGKDDAPGFSSSVLMKF
ncbi:MAG: ABC transporter substrate-binding protein [Spirochaetota bacterium]